jgi:hypothetical protein
MEAATQAGLQQTSKTATVGSSKRRSRYGLSNRASLFFLFMLAGRFLGEKKGLHFCLQI